MNCQVFENVVNDLAREQMMEATARAEAIAHSAECEVCARRLEDEHELTRRLREYSAAVRAESISSSVETKLMAEFQNRRAPVAAASQSASHRYWWSAIAAAVILAFVTVAVSWSGLATPTIQPPVFETPMANLVKPVVPRSDKVDRAVDNSSAAHSAVTGTPKPAGKRRSGLKRKVNNQETIAANFNDQEITTDFIPIGFGSNANVQDGGQLVRVEMPRSAMARFGLPVNMDRFDERVKADVLVGVDGMARAIRFVQ